MKKTHTKIRNWKEYNAYLVKRGDLTLWFDEKSLSGWNSVAKTGKRGRPQLYSDLAIQCGLTLAAIYHLPLRGVEGFLRGIIKQLDLNLKIPDYTTLCKRRKDLKIIFPKLAKRACDNKMHIVIDSTGLKVFGEGEWKVRQHSYSKRRTWRKLHLAVDSKSHIIESAVLSSNDFKDSEFIEELLGNIDGKIDKVSGDGGYDSNDAYDYIDNLGAMPLIPPRSDAVLSSKLKPDYSPSIRDNIIFDIYENGIKEWKEKTGYHRRSLAETGMFRFKNAFGSKLTARNFDSQTKEAFIKCILLNKMTNLGMPERYQA